MDYFVDSDGIFLGRFQALGGRGNLLFRGSRPLLASNLPMSI